MNVMQTSSDSVYAALVSYLESSDLLTLERSQSFEFSEGWEIAPGNTVNDVIQSALIENFVGAINVSDMFINTYNDTTFQFQATIEKGSSSSIKVCGVAKLHSESYTKYSAEKQNDDRTFFIRTYFTIQWCLDNRK